jgi:predicted CXXCH cytochrome family protein
VGFCTSCHNSGNTIWSTTLNRNLKKINWSETGDSRDKHGSLARDGEEHFQEPYAAAAEFKPNFVLSCLDCHESHGSANIMLLRRRINGQNLEATITAAAAMGYACKRCHNDDLAAQAGTGQANSWEYVHHLAAGAPYAKSGCTDCHASGDPISPIPCGNCHGHGMDDSWAGIHQTGRKTF